MSAHLLAIRCRRNVWAEWARLRNAPHNPLIRDGDGHRLRIEGRAHITVATVRREYLHARTARHGNPRLLRIAVRIQDGDVVLAADSDPHLLTVRREKRLMRRAAHVGNVL